MLIDIHAHLQSGAYDADREAIIQQCAEQDISVINVGTNRQTSQDALVLAHRYPERFWAAVGLHPTHLISSPRDPDESASGSDIVPAEEFQCAVYRELARDEKTVGIGECGLDYFHLERDYGFSPEQIAQEKERQQEVFAAHIRLAKEVGKPLVIHCRDAYGDVLAVVRREGMPAAGGDVHFFAGDMQTAQQFLDLGFSLSFTGAITFKNAAAYADVIRSLPLDRLMAETDAPYVAPEPFRGTRNTPLYVRQVVEKIAAIRNISFDEAALATFTNAKKLFKLG